MATAGYVQAVFCGIVMFVIVVGNAFVVAAYYSNVRLRTAMYTFLVSLAVSDFLVGSVSLPLWIFFTETDKMKEERLLYQMYLSFDIFSALASIFHLTAVSLERWLAVCRPFYYHTLSKKAYLVSIMGVWVSAFLISLLRWILYKISLKPNASQFYTPLLLLFGCVGPGIIIALVNFKVFQVAKSLAQALPIPGQMLNMERDYLRQQMKGQRRTALTLTCLTVLFFISWTPFIILSTVTAFCHKCLPPYESDGGLALFTLSKWLQYCSSALNPLVYAFRDREMRRTFLELLLRCCKCFRRVRKNSSSARVQPEAIECTNREGKEC